MISWFAWRFFACGFEDEAPDEGVQDPPRCPTNDSAFRRCSWGRVIEKPHVFLFLLRHYFSPFSLSLSIFLSLLVNAFEDMQTWSNPNTTKTWDLAQMMQDMALKLGQHPKETEVGYGEGCAYWFENMHEKCQDTFLICLNLWYMVFPSFPKSQVPSHCMLLPPLYCAGGASCFSGERGAAWFRAAHGRWWDWEVFCRYIFACNI